MPLTLTNPAGLWALLAVPVILLIHFLQRQSITLPVSTLFLLEKLERESVQGQNFDRLKNSIPLWMQLLVALLFTWILIAPRWEKSDSLQRVAVIIDSSASMRAFTEDAITSLEEKLPPILAPVSRVELSLVESHETGDTLYHGSDLPEMLDTLREWKPARSAHDPNAALRIGRSLVGDDGILIYLTDHKSANPGYGAKLLAVGSPIENVGFAGISVSEEAASPRWKVIVRNYGVAVAEREWILTAGGNRTEPRKISLKAGQAVTLEGRFPDETDRITLQLEPDQFELDDQSPVIIPRPKPLTISRIDSKGLTDTFSNILETLENVSPPKPEQKADLTFYPYNPISPTSQEGTGIVMIDQGEIPRNFQKGAIVATNHPLVKDLNWQGLIARASPSVPFFGTDIPLLWQGDHALIFLQESETGKLLIFNFDIPSSNADRLPAFIVMIHRFIESIRDGKIAEASDNYELSQLIPVAHHLGTDAPPLAFTADAGVEELPLSRSQILRASESPGFFSVSQGEQFLVQGAAHFADTREADFKEAGSFSDLEKIPEAIVDKHTVPDRLWQIWLVLALIALFAAWYSQSRPVSQNART